MRKLPFLLGAVGGALGGFILSNKPLRKKLSEAKTKKDAATILGEAIQKSGTEIAHETKKFIESEDTKKHLAQWKGFACKKWKTMRNEALEVASKATQSVQEGASTAVSRAKKAMKRGK